MNFLCRTEPSSLGNRTTKRGEMSKQIGLLSFAGLLLFGCAAFAQPYQLDLTGVAPDQASADNVYVSPYQGTISLNGSQIFSGYMICDDFTDESNLNDPWYA